MPHQYSNHVINQSTKRRMHDDEEEDQVITFTKQDQGTKRLNDLSQEFNPNNKPPKADTLLPSLTYASPDYRPPPRADALWLQPVPPPQSLQPSFMPSTPLETAATAAAQPMMEEDSTDEDDILPCFNSSTTTTSATTKQTTDFDWIMADQC